MKIFFFNLILLLSLNAFAQVSKKVCFIGNSYIYTNDLPTLISNLANADGNNLIKDQNTLGGYTLQGHSTNSTSLAKIASNGWDYVVLQEQSQLPSFEWSQVSTDVLPFAKILCDSVRSANPCAIPIFFDTWGRENGDPQWDSIDTFTEMNQRLYNTYEYMANSNSTLLSPVGIAYEHIANDVSAVVSFNSLYIADESHPTIFGSYLAACIFYELIFETNSVGNLYLPVGINASEAGYLQTVAHHVLNNVDTISTSFIQPVAEFTFSVSGLDVSFTNESTHYFESHWNFGDGNSSSAENPNHTYAISGTYNVQLITSYCDRSDTIEYSISTNNLNLYQPASEGLAIYPNPSSGMIYISGLQEETMVWIYSAEGRLIKEIKTDSSKINVTLEPGTYLIKTKTSSQLLLVQ